MALCTLQFASAQTIYVDVHNTSGIEDGTPEHPFNTVEEGISAATAGTTVMIKAGSYHPDSSWQTYSNALYLKPGVNLKGEGPEGSVIEGVLVDWDEGTLPCVIEEISFLEYHCGRATQEGPFPGQNVIRNCQSQLIEIAHGAGIPVNDTTPGPIFGFLIEDNDLGEEGSVRFQQGSGVANNTVQRNLCGSVYIYSGGGYTYFIDDNDISYGIKDASGANQTTISNNRIVNGAIIDRSSGNPYGVEDQFIVNNVITCHEDAPLLEEEDVKAALLVNPTSVSIRNNTITCTGKVSGIYSKANTPFHVQNNVIVLDEVTQLSPEPDESACGIYSKAGWGYVTGNTIRGGEIGYYSKAGTVTFSGNSIDASWIGFHSSGAEEVYDNVIENCKTDGMILMGLRGPIHHNTIRNNAGSGILAVRTDIDLGGGADNSPGGNVLTGNGNFDLYVASANTQSPVLYARHNVWDHTDPEVIMEMDIRDGYDSTGLVVVDILPLTDELDAVSPWSPMVEVFPNPAEGALYIRCSMFEVRSSMFEVRGSRVEVRGLLEIVDLMGKGTGIGYSGTMDSEGISLDISALPSGIYFYILSLKIK